MTNRPVTIVVLSKYKAILEPCIRSLVMYQSKTPVVFVLDGDDIDPTYVAGERSIVIKGPEQFSMAGNGNLGLKAVPQDHDILYIGDDIRFLEPKTVERLQDLAYKDEKIGILSPRLIGRGSPTLVNPKDEVQEVRPIEMWFPCVYIKREVIDEIGYLDEIFNNFGSDDLDFCIRAKMAGYKLVVTSKVVVKHDASPEGGPTTFCKKLGVDTWQHQQQAAFQKLREKYNVSPVIFDRFLMTGDVSLLQKTEKEEATKVFTEDLADHMLCRPDEANDFLKTRHIFIATPAYGGWMSVNYVQSLIALIDLCRDIGVKHTTSFMYNESLITRARNKLTDNFLKMEDATDLIFIDADIGFDPRAVLTLALRNEDVIGAPCVRKNLRLDRIVEAVKKNGKAYTIDELQLLTGEYVLNFAPESAPTTMNLGQPLEVLEVGTGLMRIRRDTLTKLAEKFPNDWYLQMMGETDGSRLPLYMYFQAAIDNDTKERNGGFADYISEDYYFCRKVRKAGMKVWVAPWIKTDHMGSYFFRGDLEAVAMAGGSLR